jgi:transposase InsO family protein
VAFVDANRGDIVEGRKLGVEPICEILQVVPSSYYAAKRRQPSQRSVRDEQLSVRDEQLTPQLLQLWEANYRLYGARKLWKAARRAGHDVGRDQVARLMRAAGIEGVTRTKHVRTCHSDAGSQFTSLRYGERLAELGTVPSIGTVGDSFDNALAETVNGYYKAELIRGPARTGPWKTVEDVEFATLGWVHRHNTTRLHGYLGDRPPAELETGFYAAHTTDQQLVGIQ